MAEFPQFYTFSITLFIMKKITYLYEIYPPKFASTDISLLAHGNILSIYLPLVATAPRRGD